MPWNKLFFSIRIQQQLWTILAIFDALLEELSYRRHCMDVIMHHDENAFSPSLSGAGLGMTSIA
jgi:hypothetical protein